MDDDEDAIDEEKAAADRVRVLQGLGPGSPSRGHATPSGGSKLVIGGSAATMGAAAAKARASAISVQAAMDSGHSATNASRLEALDTMIRTLISEKDPKRRDPALLRRLVAEKGALLASFTVNKDTEML